MHAFWQSYVVCAVVWIAYIAWAHGFKTALYMGGAVVIFAVVLAIAGIVLRSYH